MVDGRRSSSWVDVLTRLSVVQGLVGGSGYRLMGVRDRESRVGVAMRCDRRCLRAEENSPLCSMLFRYWVIVFLEGDSELGDTWSFGGDLDEGKRFLGDYVL